MKDGWIKLYRELLDKPIWKQSTPEQKCILVVLLLMANHKPNEWEWKGVKFNVDSGQFVTSLNSIKETAGCGISTQNVRTALRRFESLEFLTNRATKNGRIISIINWESYQPPDSTPQQRCQQRPNKDLTPNKNERRKENIYKKKEDFWYLKAVSIPIRISFTDKMQQYLIDEGCEDEKHHNYLFKKFVNYYGANGKPRRNWTRTFFNWVLEDKKKYNSDKYKQFEDVITKREEK